MKCALSCYYSATDKNVIKCNLYLQSAWDTDPVNTLKKAEVHYSTTMYFVQI